MRARMRSTMSTPRSTTVLVVLLSLLAGACEAPPPTLAPDGTEPLVAAPESPPPELVRKFFENRDKDYPLYTGDVVRITIQGHDELTVERKIPQSGRIPLYGLDSIGPDGAPVAREVVAAGLRVPQLEERLKPLYSRIVNPPYVTVRVVEYAPKVIYVAGAVNGPREYNLPNENRISLVQALTMAGWFSRDAASDRVRVIRQDPDSGRRIHLPPIDVARIVSVGDTGTDLLLDPGDTITVDSRGAMKVYIFGHVQQAGEFDYETGLTLTRLVTKAGGFKSFAKMTDVRVIRGNGGPEQAYHFNVEKILSGEARDIPLEPGDRVWVDERFI